MKRNFSRTTLTMVLSTLVYVGLAPAARAQDEGSCSYASVAGKWGFSLTGTLLLSTGAVPGGAVGTLTVDAAGNISGMEARSIGGSFANETITGKWTVNSDCTGTASFQVYESGVLVRKTAFSFVFVDNSTGFFAVEQSLKTPDGTVVPAVITANAKKLFSER
jgi:hypothetical protein